FTMGLAVLSLRVRRKKQVLLWMAATFVLGLTFLGLEINEFHHLAVTGNSWRRSGFLSAFFTLVSTHGLHITSGLIWMATMFFKINKAGLTRVNIRRLTLLSIFWHFLDIVWIFIFTVVYLIGAL
ncbi:MAG: cytochrome c oxidase subunit 3, partial [Candidatus Saccharimonadales bacterium]